MNFQKPSGPRNPEEMSHMMSEFHRQSLVQQPPTDQSAQPSTGYGLFSMQTSTKTPSELEPSQRSWPQSDFVSSVIEGPIEHTNPGWRDHDPVTASALRQRAEAGMQNVTEATPAKSLFQRNKSQPGFLASTNSLNGSTNVSRDGRKTIPSHLSHMKYKGFDPTEISSGDTSSQRVDPALKGTASFGTKARRRTDTVSLVEEEQKRKDLEHQLANFPPILPGSLWNSLSEEEAESRRIAAEDDVRLRWNIPNRPASPTLTRRSTYHKHGSLNRRTSVSAPQEDNRASSSAINIGTTTTTTSKPDSDMQVISTPNNPTNDVGSYSSVRVTHPLLISNNNTWNHILDHMRNHGTIVNPFNHQAKFRLKACFPPGTPIDILASGDIRQLEYPVNQEMLRKANEIVMGPDWIKMTYETKAQASASLISTGVHFDGCSLEVSVWDDADDHALKNGAITERPRWMAMSSDIASALPLRKSTLSSGETSSIAPVRDRQLILISNDAIFVKQPGIIDRIKEFVFAYLFQNTARYDEEGNYIRGSGGVFLDLWHILVG